MEKEISIRDLICETHIRLKRQGPGSPEMTINALNFLDNLNENSQILDLGCGTGGQTMTLAENITGNIIGIDLFPEFIDVFNKNAKKLNLQERVKGIVASMDKLPFQKEKFDLIWSEGAIDNIGFEKRLTYWNKFLKKDAYVVVTCPSWFINEPPIEIEKFWNDAGSRIDTIENNILIMENAGYIPITTFKLPENCWTDNYFIPREVEEKTLLEKNLGNKTIEDYIENGKYEVELYSKYKEFYGYVFYIAKKI